MIDHLPFLRASSRLPHPRTLAWPVLLFLAMLLGMTAAQGAPAQPAFARVRLVTSLGPIVIQVETKRAPITAANFLAYVDQKKFDGTNFYRAARGENDPKTGSSRAASITISGVRSSRSSMSPPA